ncbi:hypothetical protein D3C72_2253170 [compost metagenome]
MAISRCDGGRPATLRPLIEIVPDVMGSSPAIVLSRVDLPQPEGPTSTRKPPSSISILMSFRISSAP